MLALILDHSPRELPNRAAESPAHDTKPQGSAPARCANLCVRYTMTPIINQLFDSYVSASACELWWVGDNRCGSPATRRISRPSRRLQQTHNQIMKFSTHRRLSIAHPSQNFDWGIFPICSIKTFGDQPQALGVWQAANEPSKRMVKSAMTPLLVVLPWRWNSTQLFWWGYLVINL